MKVSDKLDSMYGDYYADGKVAAKRRIAARQTVSHLLELTPSASRPYPSLLDVGAGDGAVLAELQAAQVATDLHAVEISESGCGAIVARNLDGLRSVRRFDGYRIEAADGAYALGVAVHVLEHVEHERAFLAELGRVSKEIYIEVPLELTARPEHAMRVGAPYGHINFYNPATFRNLLRSSNLEVVRLKVYPNSRDYEVLVGGRLRGGIKHLLRSGLLKGAPALAPYAMAYVAGAYCRRAERR